jgi:hypothetical protein
MNQSPSEIVYFFNNNNNNNYYFFKTMCCSNKSIIRLLLLLLIIEYFELNLNRNWKRETMQNDQENEFYHISRIRIRVLFFSNEEN